MGDPPDQSPRFGDFELLEEIARGGMGIVFKARQISLERIVAFKLLLSGRLADSAAIARFRAEALAAAQLQHPHVVPVYEVGVAHGQPYLVMEWIRGPDLATLTSDQPLAPARAARITRAIALALQHAHERGILHRDLKPSNVLIDGQDQPHITDFGLAKQFQGAPDPSHDPLRILPDLTLSGQIIGSPGYIAPEQASGRRADVGPASDVYSVGAVLYHLLTTRAPFQAATLPEILQHVIERPPVSPRLLNPHVPRALETICLTCLAKEPSRRYATARDLAEDLQRFLEDHPILARPEGSVARLARWVRRRPVIAGLAASLCAALVFGSGGIVWQWRRAEATAARESAQRHRAEDSVTSLELQRAESLLEKDEVVEGIAHLVRLTREHPDHPVPGRRLLAALAYQNLWLPEGPPLRHDRRVWSAVFSPDGTRIATGSLDQTARVWDTRSGQPVTPPLVHPFGVRTVQFSPDGQFLVSAGDGIEARLWHVGTGRQAVPGMLHSNTVWFAQFSPDGSRLLTASRDHTAWLWDLPSGKPVSPPLPHRTADWPPSFSLDGRYLLTAVDEHTSQTWEAATGRPGAMAWRHPHRLRAVEFSSDGHRLLASTFRPGVAVRDLPTGRELLDQPFPLTMPESASAARFSPEGWRMVTGLRVGIAQVWDVHSGRAIGHAMSHRAGIWSTEFSPDGLRVLTSSADNSARLWDAATGSPAGPAVQHDDIVWSARFSPDGRQVVTASADHTARLWNVVPAAARSRTIGHIDGPADRTFAHRQQLTPDGLALVGVDGHGVIRIWSTAGGESIAAVTNNAPVLRVDCSPDSQRVAVAGGDGVVHLWNRTDGTYDSVAKMPGHVISDLEFSPDSRWLAIASEDGHLTQWPVRGRAPRCPPIINRGKVESFAYSPDGRWLFCSDFKDDQARLHDAATGALLAKTTEREGRILHAAFSPEGRSVAAGYESGQVIVWRVPELQPELVFRPHRSGILWTQFSPDGARLLTTSDDGTTRIWHRENGQPVGQAMRHRLRVHQAVFSPDGRTVATASEDHHARLWHADSGRPLCDPWVHGSDVLRVEFSKDGRHVFTVAMQDSVRVWDVPPSVTPGSALLLADLATAVIGHTLQPDGTREWNAPVSLDDIRQTIDQGKFDTGFHRWCAWFLADRSSRTLSPWSDVTIPEHVARLTAGTNVAEYLEALRINPTEGLAYAKLAGDYRRRVEAGEPGALDRLDWASRLAIRHAPASGLPWVYRLEAHQLRGSWNRLSAETEAALPVHPDNPFLWQAHARALLETGRAAQAIIACQAGLDLCSGKENLHRDKQLRQELLDTRARAVRVSEGLKGAATTGANLER